MPKKGYISLTIHEQLYKIAENDAKSEHRSPANYLKHLILQEHELKKQSKKLRSQIRNGHS